VNDTLQMIFTAPNDPDDEFVFSFPQLQNLWRAYSGEALSPDDYKRLYSTIDTKLRVGKLKDEIIKYPELDRYVGYKLKQFKASYQWYQMHFS
jgi:hypothetical protein